MPQEVSCPSCSAANELREDAGQRCRRCGSELEPLEGLSGRSTVGGAAPGRGPQSAGPPEETVRGEETLSGARQESPDESTTWQEGMLVAGRFRLLKFIGQGGMGKVYLALDETLKRHIALKRIPQEIIFDGDARDDLRHEANRLLDLAHENIVRVHTYYDGPHWPFFAMEYLSGPTLKKLLRARRQEGRSFSPEEVLCVARQVGEGLSHAHARNVVHRDLKPANLMLAEPAGDLLRESDTVKITDFGISRVVADSTLRQTGKRSGTVPYMSPEQFRGEPSTVQGDIYSLACTLYELLSGRPPFYSGDVGYQILNLPPPALRDVPKPVASAILRALAKDPRDRFASVKDFVRALEGKAVSLPLRRWSRNVAWVTTTAIGGLLLVGLLVFLVQSALEPPEVRSDLRTARNPALPARPGLAGAALKDDLERFRSRLLEEVQRQLPERLGRPPGAAGLVPSRSITLSFAEGAPGGLPSSFLSHVVFTCVSAGASGGPGGRTVRGVEDGGTRRFMLHDLVEGSYLLSAHLEREAGTGVVHERLWEHKFHVDLTPPSFVARPLDPTSFVDPRRLATFQDSAEVLLELPPDAVKVFLEAKGVPLAVADPKRVVLALAPGRNDFRVIVEDAAGNRTEEPELVIERYELRLDSLELERVLGNVAAVSGRLQFEGGASPGLRFFVNDRLVPDARIEVIRDTVTGGGTSSVQSRTREFRTQLQLDQSVNTLEVRYVSTEGGMPVPFSPPYSLSPVKVAPPEVKLEPRAELVEGGDSPALWSAGGVWYTRRSQLAVKGRVEPFFEGLEVRLDVQGRAFRTVALVPQAEGPAASFSEEVTLIPGEENRIAVSCTYRGQALIQSSVPALQVVCDQTPPRCARTRLAPELDQVEIEVSEPLRQLGVRLAGAAEYTQLDPDLAAAATASGNPTYYWPVPHLSPGSRVQVQLVDLAGNAADCEEPLELPPKLPGRPTAREEPDGGAGHVPAATGGPAVIQIRSPFLGKLDMEFVPFGSSRLEMGRTEVPERAWRLFLAERGDVPAAGRGREGDRPMVLGQENPPTLLVEFARWFGKQAADGYDYFVPTESQWLCAFAGVKDPEQARQVIRQWFTSPRRGDQRGFNPSPGVRYGVNWLNHAGSRPENATPGDLLDMESNAQEIVYMDREPGFGVIGGYNTQEHRDEMLGRCLAAWPYDPETRKTLGQFTGFRLCRRPRGAR